MGLLQDLGLFVGGTTGAGSTTGLQAQQNVAGTYPGQLLPTVPNVPYFPPQTIPQFVPAPTKLSDFDIELMATCISNKHPNVEGRNTCFCSLKRLEKGIGKE